MLFVFICSDFILQGFHDDITVLLDYLPANAHRGDHCPFTLISSWLYTGMIKQPSSDSRTFGDDDFSLIEKPSSPFNLSLFPLPKTLFSFRLRRIPATKTRAILSTEMQHICAQFNERAADDGTENLLKALSTATTGELTDAVVWMRLFITLLRFRLGREAFTFLRDVSLLSEVCPLSPQNVERANCFAVELRVHLVGPEFRLHLEQTLRLLLKYSFIRYFLSRDGNLTVMMPTLLRDLARLAPCDWLKSEINATLLSLAQLGHVHLTVQQMLKLQGEINSLAANSFAQLSEIRLSSGTADPAFQKNFPAEREKLEEEIIRLTTGAGSRSPKMNNYTYENVGIKAGGDFTLEAGAQMSFVVGNPSASNDGLINDKNGVNCQPLGPAGSLRRRGQFPNGGHQGIVDRQDSVAYMKVYVYTIREVLVAVSITFVFSALLTYCILYRAT